MAATLPLGSNPLSLSKDALARRDLLGPLLPYRLISFGLWPVIPLKTGAQCLDQCQEFIHAHHHRFSCPGCCTSGTGDHHGPLGSGVRGASP